MKKKKKAIVQEENVKAIGTETPKLFGKEKRKEIIKDRIQDIKKSYA